MNDFSRSENGDALYSAGVRAFTDYAPVTYTSANGLYRTFRWERNLELFGEGWMIVPITGVQLRDPPRLVALMARIIAAAEARRAPSVRP